MMTHHRAHASSPPPRRILVVDDHAIVRHGLIALLAKEKDLTVCAEAGSYEEAMEAVASAKPDILIVDISLKGKSGLDLVADLRKSGVQTPAIVLSMHDESTFAEKALKAGAQGYVMKENADEVILQAIAAVLRGEVYVSKATSDRMLRQMMTPKPSEAPETGIESLTDRELEIFECIGRGLNTRRIAELLALSDRTVEVHRAHIKKKMQCEDSARLIREAVRWVEQKQVPPAE